MGNLSSYLYTSNKELDYGQLNDNHRKTVLSKEDLPKLLLNTPVFSNLSLSDIKQLVLCFRKRKYKKDEIIIKQGKIGHEFYLIWKGSVRVLINNNQVATLKIGDTFGEAALLTGKSRNATVESINDNVELLIIDKCTFIAITNRAKNYEKEKENIIGRKDKKNWNENENKNENDDIKGEIDGALSNILDYYGLLTFCDQLTNDLGVETLEDLKYLDKKDYESIGCKTVQIKKFEEIVSVYCTVC